MKVRRLCKRGSHHTSKFEERKELGPDTRIQVRAERIEKCARHAQDVRPKRRLRGKRGGRGKPRTASPKT